MQRFGEARELTFAIPERSWMYSFKEPFNHTMIRWPLAINNIMFQKLFDKF